MFVSYFDTKLVMFVSIFDTFALILFLNRMFTMTRLEFSIKVSGNTKEYLNRFKVDFPQYSRHTYNEIVMILLRCVDESKIKDD